MRVDDANLMLRMWWDRVWRQGDLTAVDDMVGDEYTLHTSDGTEVLDREQFKARLVQYQRVLHGAVTTIDDLAVGEDRIWHRATSRGVNLETHGPAVMSWLIVHRIEHGRFAEMWVASVPGVDWHN